MKNGRGDVTTRVDAPDKMGNAVAMCVSREFSGPLPSPETLKGYADVSPEIVRVVVEMAQKEQELREKALDASINESRREQSLIAFGLWFSGVILLVSILAGVLCAILGKEWPAVAAFGVSAGISWLVIRPRPKNDKLTR